MFGGLQNTIVRPVIDAGRLTSIQREKHLLPPPAWPRASPRLLDSLATKSREDIIETLAYDPVADWDKALDAMIRRVPFDVDAVWPQIVQSAPVLMPWEFNLDSLLVEANRRIGIQPVADGQIIFVDRNTFASFVLFLMLIWMHGRGGAYLAGWLGLHVILEPKEPFPEFELILRDVYTAHPDHFCSVARKLAQLIVGHEMGHAYPNVSEAAFFDVVSEAVVSNSNDLNNRISSWETGAEFGLKAYVHQGSDGVHRLILPDQIAHFREEEACDIFALWSAIAAEAGALGHVPDMRHFERLLTSFVFWQPVAHLLDLRDSARWIFSGKERQYAAPGIDLSAPYPPWLARIDTQIFHLDRIGDFFKLGWKHTELTSLKTMHELVWDKGMYDASRKAMILAYQVLDPIHPESNPDRVRDMNGASPSGRCLSIFESLWWESVRPLAEHFGKFDSQHWAADLVDYTNTWARIEPGITTYFERIEEIGNFFQHHYD